MPGGALLGGLPGNGASRVHTRLDRHAVRSDGDRCQTRTGRVIHRNRQQHPCQRRSAEHVSCDHDVSQLRAARPPGVRWRAQLQQQELRRRARRRRGRSTSPLPPDAHPLTLADTGQWHNHHLAVVGSSVWLTAASLSPPRWPGSRPAGPYVDLLEQLPCRMHVPEVYLAYPRTPCAALQGAQHLSIRGIRPIQGAYTPCTSRPVGGAAVAR